MSHEEGFCTLAATILILSVSLCNTAFAVDLTDAEPIEPSYLEIIEDIFPGYQDGQVSPQWTSGAPDAANPKTHGYITQVAYNLIRNDNSAAYSFYSGRLTKLVRGSVLPDDDEKQTLLHGISMVKTEKLPRRVHHGLFKVHRAL